MPAAGFLRDWTIEPFSGAIILSGADAFKYLLSTDNGGNQVVTIQPFVDVAFDIGTQISFEQGGTSTITLALGAGVTIDSRGALLVSNGQFAVLSLVKKLTNTWTAFGDLA